MKTFFLVILSCLPIYLLAQADSLKSYTTSWVQGAPPHIDGKGDDPAWEQVAWGGGDFRQFQPSAGSPATVQTKFKILYDAKNLYVLFRNLDPEPDKIVSRMSRRDGFEGDWVEINIDSYYDKRTAFSFTSSVSGVKSDEYCSNNGEDWDENWDPIWYLKTSIDDQGWIAELRIPLSQLRFADKPELTWGFQITRRFFRNQERSLWKYFPPNETGWVHHFGDLKGIKGIKPQKQLEIQPYVLGKTERFEKEEGNPYRTGRAGSVDVGLDAKIGITSDITLDLTVNPDFGQVEADPSQVNLTAFELFFEERRPFFIEGNNTLNFPLSNEGDNILFYSRRIGRSPQGWVDTDRAGDDGVNEFYKSDSRSSILGAAKITGKNKHGFSWGVLESVTQKEYATIDSLGSTRKQAVEPMTNYLVARAQQDINKGNTIIGGMFTAVNRKLDEQQLNWLHKDAYSGGVDFVHNWRERKYYVSAKAVMSRVLGSRDAITSTQRSSERFFQRPDNHHASVNTNRTSLTGTGGTFMIGKQSGTLIGDLGFSWTSPELELNDIGFMPQTDNMRQWCWMEYRILTPKKWFRSQRYNVNEWQEWDFDGKTLSRGYNVNTHFQFHNFWLLSVGSTYAPASVSNADLRGGPAIRYPGSMNYWMFIASDQRKKLFVGFEPFFSRGFENYNAQTDLSMDIVYKPINALNISISPSLSWNNDQMQYVTTEDANGETKYIVGKIDQTTLRISIRATYMLTPNLSLQYYGQPFGTSGTYSDFKYITDASAAEYHQRYAGLSPDWMTQENYRYFVDQNQDGTPEVSFGVPDFNFGQFRSNMVLRWEYIPGSTFFLVWTQERNGAFYSSHPDHSNYTFEFNQQPHNIFLMKFTYRFVL